MLLVSRRRIWKGPMRRSQSVPFVLSRLSTTLSMIFVICVAIAIPSSAQTFTNLASFAGSNGFSPYSTLTQAADGSFYGTTEYGGNGNCSNGCGTVFKVTPSGTLTVIYSFSGPDGQDPDALVQGSDGNFYGTTFCSGGGFHRTTVSKGAQQFCSGGTVFKVSPSGRLTTLHNFNGGRRRRASRGDPRQRRELLWHGGGWRVLTIKARFLESPQAVR